MSESSYVEPYVGKTLTPQKFTITDNLLRDHHEGLELDPSATGFVPSTLGSEPDNSYFREIAYSYQKGHLWLRQQLHFFRPLRMGPSYSVQGHIEEIYPKRDRNVVHYEMIISDEDGSTAIRTNHHQSFLREKLQQESVSLRDPKAKPGARKFQKPTGEEFGNLSRRITREMCGIYFHGDENYHTEKQSARQLGFEDVVVGGRMTLAYAARVMEDFFGEAWWTSGTLDLKFTNPVWCDDVVTVKGIITGKDDDDSNRTNVFIWIEKQDDTIALVADASVIS